MRHVMRRKYWTAVSLLLTLAVTGCGPSELEGLEQEVPTGEASAEHGGALGGAVETPLCVAAVTASAHDGNVPGNTVDADLATRWSAQGDGVWIRYDFGTTRTVLAADIAWYQGAARVSYFAVEVSSDGTTWRRVHEGQSSGTTASPERTLLGGATARYVRIVGYGNTVNAYTSITEARFYAATLLPPTAVSASAHDGNVPENTLDDSLSTRWSAQGDGVWIRYDLGSTSLLTGADVAWYQGDVRSTSFALEVSSDGSAWTRVYSGSSSGTTLQLEPYAFTPVKARYLRLVGYGNTANDWTSVTSLRIRGLHATSSGSLATCDEPEPPPPSGTPDQMLATFDSMASAGFGSVTRQALESHIQKTISNSWRLEELAVVSSSNGKYLRQRYVPNADGTPSVGMVVPIQGGMEVFLSYRIYFESGWQWVLGGKLPGLAGGTYPNGGAYDDNGFSARFMWRQNGRMAVYAYHHDRPNKYGEDFFLMNADGTYFIAPIGQWFTLTERIKMNSTPSTYDGEVEVWVNGVRKLLKRGLRWRKTTGYTADRFFHNSFYGGSDSSWAPSTTTYARFDDFKIGSTAESVQ